jgi:hypothetical protein
MIERKVRSINCPDNIVRRIAHAPRNVSYWKELAHAVDHNSSTFDEAAAVALEAGVMDVLELDDDTLVPVVMEVASSLSNAKVFDLAIVDNKPALVGTCVRLLEDRRPVVAHCATMLAANLAVSLSAARLMDSADVVPNLVACMLQGGIPTATMAAFATGNLSGCSTRRAEALLRAGALQAMHKVFRSAHADNVAKSTVARTITIVLTSVRSMPRAAPLKESL